MSDRDPYDVYEMHEEIEEKDAEIASLRSKIADIKDGLTAAHMNGFALGKAEAKEMLRKRDGQLDELRAEVDRLDSENTKLREEISALHAEQDTQESLEKFAKSMSDIMYLNKLRSRAEQAEARVRRMVYLADYFAYQNEPPDPHAEGDGCRDCDYRREIEKAVIEYNIEEYAKEILK